ncbi:MAG: ATP-binding cassette domain-containing protein [Spirochaetales bacterium]|nr:ATP-binding cassette domain-containing protein [Spirochaetales bacterium]
MKRELIRLEYLSVREQGSLILEDLSLEIYEGEILGILSKNVRESDCLLKILMGETNPSGGRISFRGHPLHSYDVRSTNLINVLGKKSQLIDDFRIYDNIFVMRKAYGKFLVNSQVLRKQVEAMFLKYHVPISPDTYVYELSNLEKLIIEIIKSMILRVPVILLRFPSTFLSDKEIERLYDYVQRFQREGQTFLVMDSTSHTVRQFCNRIILLHKGKNQWSFNRKDFSDDLLAELFPYFTEREEEGVVNAVQGECLLALDHVGTSKISPINWEFSSGEINILVDETGGQLEELTRIFTGEKKDYSGRISLGGRIPSVLNPRVLLKHNIALISEDPVFSQLYPQFNGLENLIFPMGEKFRRFWTRRKFAENIKRTYAPFFSEGALEKDLKDLSPADRQSLVYLRWHLYSPGLIIIIKPFSSFDRQLESLTVSLLQKLYKRGIGLLILSSNLWEMSVLSENLPIKIKKIAPLT